ncbi:hypothetical protein H072_1456 [Dactylellina haptotyla CBS 200.50]|uniref:Aminoglycoside phosphotransferase domain-containing protein n=1 Tax=Dactylellina haptotyla (strain CBS 200.50) TaxID=1284197 RepID=S8CA35_DACHA|nr:hypothetical protein H072_1456 [Dactylellina haptotyla CBS 200.50]
MAPHETLSDPEIVELCRLGERLVGWEAGIAKISDQAMVKFGFQTTSAEATNLRIARELLDPNIVYVPRFYRFFRHEDIGYIVMEYVNGTHFSSSEYGELVNKMGEVINHFQSISGTVPGPLCGGISFGYLWDNDYPNFQTIEQLENWVNTRINPTYSHMVSFKDERLVLCHLDLSPENKWQKADGTICLVHWDMAGYYPRCFEAASFKFSSPIDKETFKAEMWDHMEAGIGREESKMARSVLAAWVNDGGIYL